MTEALKQLNVDLFGEPLDALPPRAAAAVELLSRQGTAESRGEVYTRPEIVDFILDLAGYTVNQPLHLKRVLEPSFGGGEFLLACIIRLLAAWRASKSTASITDDLANAIRAVELHRETFSITRERVILYLLQADVHPRSATALADTWNLRALQAVLLSDIVRLTMTAYATQMRGGYLRFQAQYLRRIHIPLWPDVPKTLRHELAAAAVCRDIDACNRATFKLYGLTEAEQTLLNKIGEIHVS